MHQINKTAIWILGMNTKKGGRPLRRLDKAWAGHDRCEIFQPYPNSQ